MKKLTFPLFLLLSVPLLTIAQSAGEELIDWKAGAPLSWNDYKGAADETSDAAAMTATYIGIDYHIDQNGLRWKIQCRFSKDKSWVKSRTDFILQHEQGHFDIAEIFARKLHKKMKEYKFDKNSFRTDLRKIYDSVTKEKEEYQDRYDKESDHSRKKDEQMAWTKRIARLLEELKEYSDY